MSPLTAVAAALGLLSVGYALGYAARCVRLLDRIAIWAWAQVHRRSRDLRNDPNRRRRPGWWAAQVVFAIELLGALILNPRHTVHVWRHRHDPPPPRSPAVQIRSVNRDPEEV